MACDDCKLEERVKALELECKRNQDTHREFYGKFGSIAVNSALTDERYSTIMATLAKLETAIEELKGKPGKRWETVVQSTLQWLVVAVLGAIVLFQ